MPVASKTPGGECCDCSPCEVCVAVRSCNADDDPFAVVGDATVRLYSDTGFDQTASVDPTTGRVCFNVDGYVPGTFTAVATSPTHVAGGDGGTLTQVVDCGANWGIILWPTTYDVRVQVRGCCDTGGGLPGCAVSATATGGGGGTATGTTDGSGEVVLTFPGPPAASIAVVVSPPASPRGYDGGTFNFLRAAPVHDWGCGERLLLCAFLLTSEGWACSPCCTIPMPRTLYWSDEYGSCTLNAVVVAGNPSHPCDTITRWRGGYLFTCANGAELNVYGGCTYPVVVSSWALIEVECDRVSRGFPLVCPRPFDPTCPGNYVRDSSALSYEEALAMGGPGAFNLSFVMPCDPDGPIDVTGITLAEGVCVPCWPVAIGHLSE